MLRGWGVAVALSLLAVPATAEPRWLGCKFTDANGKAQTFYMMFDEDRNIAQVLDDGQMVEGTNTYITFQAIRTRFPQYAVTYSRNDGSLSMSPLGGTAFTAGVLRGDCRRVAPPPGVPVR
jgi:hypothetical protein